MKLITIIGLHSFYELSDVIIENNYFLTFYCTQSWFSLEIHLIFHVVTKQIINLDGLNAEIGIFVVSYWTVEITVRHAEKNIHLIVIDIRKWYAVLL